MESKIESASHETKQLNAGVLAHDGQEVSPNESILNPSSVEEYIGLVTSMLPTWRSVAASEDILTLRRKNAELCKMVDDLKTELVKLKGAPRRVAELEQEVVRLCTELDVATDGVNMRGYLYKWRDRDVQIGAKWVLRYFVLRGNHLSYYGSEKDVHPWKTISLEGCISGHEGQKKNGQFHVFGIYLASTDETRRGPNSGVLVRLSSENEAEAAQWVELLTLACALASGSGAQPIEQDYKISKITNPTNIAVEDGDSPEGSPSSSLRLRKSISLQREHSKDAKQKGRDMAATYPASRPMHMCNQPSLLSEESPRQNYRGALNLAFIILVMTHFRLIIENLLKYGILLKPSMPEMLNWENLEGVLHMPLFGLVVFNLFGLVALATETLAAKGIVKDRLALNIQVCNCTLALLIPTFGVYFSTLHPLAGMLFLGEAVVLWLKLVSYAHANRDLRIARDMGYYQRPTEGQDAAAGSKFGRSQVENLENPVDYPDNLTVSNLYYFLLAPTLSYQLNYPRSPSIRWNNVLSYTSRLLFSIGLIIFVVEQYVSPLLKSSIKPIHKLQFTYIAERLMKMAIPTTYVWILGFYAYFHLWLNLMAELLRFGDRMFYKDWWNSRTVETYWRLWNMPVHHWMIRHLYFPALRMGLSKRFAIYASFLFSAVFHEVLISIPFHTIRPYAFLGMLGQAPLVILTKKLDDIFDNSFIGNAVFWVTFCMIGQPMGLLMYYYDFWLAGQGLSGPELNEAGQDSALHNEL